MINSRGAVKWLDVQRANRRLNEQAAGPPYIGKEQERN
jgi:hypothetical protein